MASKKQILFPFIFIAIGIGGYYLFSNMKKPPAEKPKRDQTPIVTTQPIVLEELTLDVSSYGLVEPKYETELVAQIHGEIVELSSLFIPGGFVKKGQLLAQIDPSDYQAALIDAEANLASAQASLLEEKAKGKVAEDEWKRITNNSPTALSLRKPQLAQEEAKVKAAKARVMTAKRNLERTNIVAPYDAIIESRLLGLGAYVSVGNKLGKLLATDVAQVRLPVAEQKLSFLVNEGTNSSVVLMSDIAGVKAHWQANIVMNEGVIDARSRMNYLVAEIDDPYNLNGNSKPIKFGAYVKAKIIGKKIANVASIPRYLITDNGLATLNDELKLHYVVVNIVREQGTEVIVQGDLSQGQLVVTSVLNYPLEGMQLALIKKQPEVDITTAKVNFNETETNNE